MKKTQYPIKKTCEWCGSDFEIKKGMRPTKRTCSHHCRAKLVWSDPDRCAKQSQTMSKVWSDPDHRAKISNSMTEFWSDPDHRVKQSQTMTEFWSDPDRCAKQSLTMKQRAARGESAGSYKDGLWRERRKMYRRAGGARTYRKVFADALGRDLAKGEAVHHIDEVQLHGINNDLSNLALFRTVGDHTRWHSGHEDVRPIACGKCYTETHDWFCRCENPYLRGKVAND